jgi:hypothetical protein
VAGVVVWLLDGEVVEVVVQRCKRSQCHPVLERIEYHARKLIKDLEIKVGLMFGVARKVSCQYDIAEKTVPMGSQAGKERMRMI